MPDSPNEFSSAGPTQNVMVDRVEIGSNVEKGQQSELRTISDLINVGKETEQEGFGLSV